MRKKLRRLIVTNSIFLLIEVSMTYAAPSAQLQLAIAVPDPIVGGGEITIQTIIFNNGTDVWKVGEYSLEVEVFDSNKNYVMKPPRKRGTQAIKPSEAALFYLPFTIPASASGAYFYKVYLVYKEQRIMESDFFGFNVIALAKPERPSLPEEKPLQIGGNTFISYKNSSRYNWADYEGNFNLNLIGSLKGKPLMFNLNTYYRPTSTSTPSSINNEIYTILFSYYGSGWTLSLGDVLPVISPLSLYGTGMRGGNLELKLGAIGISVTGARTVSPREGTELTDGTYERLLGALGAEYELIEGVFLGASYLYGFDRKDSIIVTGPTLKPTANSVTGGTLKYRPSDKFFIVGEYQNSSYRENVDISSNAVNDYAWRTEVKFSPSIFNFRGSYQMTGPDYYSFGAPIATKDRKTLEIGAGALLVSRLNLSIAYTNYTDNVKNDPAKVTTNQNVYSGVISYTMPSEEIPSPSISYSLNEAYASEPNRSALDNLTNTFSVGLSGRLGEGIFGYSTSLQRSEFTDKNKISDDLRSDTFSVGLNFNPIKTLNSNLGMTISITDDVITNSRTDTQSISGAINCNILPDRLGSQLWGSWTINKNPLSDVDTSETNMNIEFTFQFKKGGPLAWTLGGSVTKYEDFAAGTISDVNGFNTRLNYSF